MHMFLEITENGQVRVVFIVQKKMNCNTFIDSPNTMKTIPYFQKPSRWNRERELLTTAHGDFFISCFLFFSGRAVLPPRYSEQLDAE